MRNRRCIQQVLRQAIQTVRIPFAAAAAAAVVVVVAAVAAVAWCLPLSLQTPGPFS